MKKFLLLVATLLIGMSAWAQTNPPADVTATALSSTKVKVAWNAPSGTTNPVRLNLFNQAYMVTHPGAGYNGADVSALYGGQGTYGPNANADSKFWIADDFTLGSAAQVREIEFYAYQTNSSTTSTFTGCYVNIYDTEPLDSTATPVWTSDTISCMTSTSWTGIYRTTGSALTDTARPIMRIVAGINTTLPAGNYWVAVCFSGSLASGPWAAPVAILGQVSTGNAIQYLPGEGAWGPWQDGTSYEQLGMPFIIRGEFVSENLRGFNVYKDNTQLNNTLIEGFYYEDEGLEEETEYCYTVEAVYTTGSAMSESACATTPYNPCRIVNLPYSESFDTYGTGYSAYPNVAYPTCWSKINTTTATSTLTLSYPYITTTNYSAPGSLYMYAGTNYYTMAITPLIDSNNIAINNLRASMMLYKSSASYNLVVGTIVDPSDPNTFEPYDTLSPTTTSTWQPFSVDFNNYTGNAHYIALRSGSGSATNYVYVDNFTLDYIPTCEGPSEISVTATTANSITVSWTPITPASLWNIEYKMQDDEDWTPVDGLTTTSYTFDNLEPSTTYSFTFKVKAICAADDESAWVSESITASTSCIAVTELPYFEGFENYGYSTAGSEYPICWTRPVSYSTSTTTAPFCNTSQKHSGNASLRFQGRAWAATPQFDEDIHNLQVSFWLRKEGASSGDFQIGVMSNPSDTSTFELVETLPVATNGTWYYYEFNLNTTQLTGSGNYIAFRQANTTSNIYYYWLDDVDIHAIPTCLRPTDLSFSDITMNSVNLHWSDEYEVNNYELRYKTSEETEWNTVSGINDTTYMLDNLTSSSTYEVQVRTVCTGDDYSLWSDGITFNTLCGPVSEFPYFEGFENYGSSTAGSEYPTCWIRPVSYSTSTTTAPFCNTSQKHSGNASLRFQGKAWAATPQLNEDIHNLQVSFWLRKEGVNSGDFQVGVMSDPSDTSTFELVETCAVSATATWYYYEINFNNTQLTGEEIFIAFRQANTTYTNWYYWLDDVDVHYIPTCLYPSNLTSSDATQNSVTLSWHDDNNAPYFTVRYRLSGAEEWIEETAYDTTITLYSLSASSVYEWQVKAHCAADDESVWSVTPAQFTTECGAISSFPYHETFDAYGTGYSGYPNVAYPTCWTKFNNTTATSTLTLSYPYINTTNYSAPGSLYMYSGTNYYTMAMLPVIDSTIGVEINELQISFMGRKTSAAYNVVVGVMTDPTIATTFVPLDTISPSATSTWEFFEVPLSNYEGTGRYIAFRCGSGTATNGFYIDNVSVDYIPNCLRPNDVTFSGIGVETANVSWTANGNESGYQILYMAEDDEEWTEINGVSDNNYEFTDLDAATTYLVKIKALCDNGQESEYSIEKSFTTLCTPLDTLPFIENFDSYASGVANYPECWIRQTNATTNYPYVSSSYYVSPSRGLYFYSTTTNTTWCYAALPAFSEDIDMRDLQVSFKARKSSAANRLEVGVMSDPYDLNTYTVVTTISPAATSTWEDFTVYLNSYTGSGKHIVFKTPAGEASTFYLDDINVDYAPECLLPTNVRITNITSSEATVNWGASEDETDWQIVYGPAGFSMDTVDPITININPYTLTDLQPNTTYDVYLRTLCNNGEISAYTAATTFTTGCAPLSLPYSENFDSYGTGTTVYPDCWQKINNNTNFPYIYAMSASTGLTLPGALYFNTTSTTVYAYAILPEFDAELNTLQMSFAFKAAMGNGYFLEVGVMEDATDTSSFEPIQTIEPRTAVWNSFTVAFTGYEGTGRYIAIRSQRVGATNTCYIDNVVVDYAPGCVAPMHLEVENLTTTTAEVSWRAGRDETEWVVAYGPTNFNPNVTGVSQTVNENPFTLTNLEPGTFYDFYVKAVCDAEESSAWSMKGSFRTDCLLIDTLPYTESFDTYGTGTTAFPNCWNRNTTYSTTTQYPYINTTNFSAPGSLYFYSTSTTYNYVTLPEFDESIDISTLRVNFKLRKTSAAYHLKVGVMTDPNDKNTFVEIARVSPSATSTWETFKVDFYSYTGQGHFIAFASDTSASNYMYLDDVSVIFAPTCHEVENVIVNDISTNGATISWTTIAEGTSWDVEYGPAGFEPGTAAGTTVNVTDTFALLTGLTSSTMYDVYVRQNCAGGDESPWSEVVGFSTNCTPISVPYTEDFNSYVTSSSSATAPSDYPNDQMPLCWSFLNRSTSSTTYPAAFLTSYSTYAVSGNCLFFKSSSSTPLYAILPEFSEDIQSLSLKFTYRNEGVSAYNGTLSVGYITDPTDATTFTELSTFAQTTTMTTDSVNFSTVPSTASDAFIAFKYTGGSSNNYYLSIDNVIVTSNGSAPVVTDPTVATAAATNVAQTTATLNATITNPDNVTITSKGFEYKVTNGGTYTQIAGTGTGNTFTANLTGLTANTGYTYKAFITFNGTTVYGGEMTFTTLNDEPEPCDAPTNVTVSNVTYNSASVTWTAGTGSAWNVQYRTTDGSWSSSIAVTAATCDLSGLNAETGYEVRVQTNCGDLVSDWVSTTFTTAAAPVEPCDAPTNLQITDITQTSAVMTWTAGGDETSWKVGYKSHEASQWQEATVTATSYTIEGLVADHYYDVRVKAVCANSESDFITGNFNTAPGTSIDNFTLASSINLMPNPADNYIELTINSNVEVKEAVVFNAFGQMIQTVELNNNHARIDLSNMASGMYFVRVSGDNATATKKFIKK